MPNIMHNGAVPVLSVRDLGIALPPGADREWAVRDVSFDIAAGQTQCIVGESGSGKSVVAQAIMGMLPPALPLREGEVELLGTGVPSQRAAAFNALRGPAMAMVFQDAAASLNPIQKVGRQLEEILEVHNVPRAGRRARVMEMLRAVMLPDPERAYHAFPHQMSGGQAQRIVIAGALLLNPKLLIADEPTTALDVTTQAEILALIDDLKTQFGTAVLFITHDFGVVAEIADTIIVMKDGAIVERGSVEDVLAHPQHDYTQRLLDAAALHPRAGEVDKTEILLHAENLSLTYKSGLFLNRRSTAAVRNVSLALAAGQTLAVVGESGSGKSSLARALLRLEDVDQGVITFRGRDITHLPAKSLRDFRAKVQVVLQDPFGALNPRFKILDAIAEGPIIQGVPKAEAHRRAVEMLDLVGLTPQAAERYPQEFSGGQRQRICIARALVMQPEVLIADEAVSALDVSIQVQILDLFADLQRTLGFAMIFITHDLRVAASVSNDVIVMKSGQVVEQGSTPEVFVSPQHAYTKSLLAAAPGTAQERAA